MKVNGITAIANERNASNEHAQWIPNALNMLLLASGSSAPKTLRHVLAIPCAEAANVSYASVKYYSLLLAHLQLRI